MTQRPIWARSCPQIWYFSCDSTSMSAVLLDFEAFFNFCFYYRFIILLKFFFSTCFRRSCSVRASNDAPAIVAMIAAPVFSCFVILLSGGTAVNDNQCRWSFQTINFVMSCRMLFVADIKRCHRRWGCTALCPVKTSLFELASQTNSRAKTWSCMYETSAQVMTCVLRRVGPFINSFEHKHIMRSCNNEAQAVSGSTRKCRTATAAGAGMLRSV
jgi:hypothetical protein